MGDSYTESSSVSRDLIRLVFSFLDRPAFWLLGISYQLFFNVASADLFSNATIMKFYGRVQVILGVFMMFQLAMTILRGIIQPDSFSKDKGGGSLIRRIAVSLILITVLMPISITNPRNEYEKQLNNNGLLFGTLYSLQHRILSNNTLGRLVLGTTASESTYIKENDTELAKTSRVFTSTVLKGFYRINLVPEDQRVDSGTKDPATINENRMCKNIDDSILEAYTRLDADPQEIISMVNETCTTDFNPCNWLKLTSSLCGSKKYMFTYMPILPMVVAIIFVFILLSFTIDVAVRAVKLAVLRLIAPIPIIAYMDPQGSGDEAFKSWTKILTSTYIDLFVRLAVVYFVIFIIQDTIVNGLVIEHGSGFLGFLSLIIIWVGLFVFAKQAPKFIKQVLGIKGDGGSLFSGFKELAAVSTIGAGYLSGGISNAVAKYQNTGGNTGKKIAAAIGGFTSGSVGGAVNAGKGYFSSEKPDAKANMARIRENNARNYSNAADDSTPGGRFVAGLQDAIGLQTKKQQLDTQAAYYDAASSATDRILSAFSSNGDAKVTLDDAFMSKLKTRDGVKALSFDATGNIKDRHGQIILEKGKSYSLKDLQDRISEVSSSDDFDMKKAVTEASKLAQEQRFELIRSFGATPEGRRRLQAEIDSGSGDYTEKDLVAYDAAVKIYKVAKKYQSDETFEGFRGKEFDQVGFGKYKRAGKGAGDRSKAIKASSEYAKASADAQRVAESKKK